MTTNSTTSRSRSKSMPLTFRLQNSLSFGENQTTASALSSVEMPISSDICQRADRMLQNRDVPDTATGREAQRRKTRARVLDAAIVEAAGVARSTFYFHFPTKDHVLLELIRRDEDYLAEELGRFLDTPRALPAVLHEIIRLVVALENRWGASLFRDVISLYFSPAAPEDENWTKHPMFLLLAAEIERPRIRGKL